MTMVVERLKLKIQILFAGIFYIHNKALGVLSWLAISLILTLRSTVRPLRCCTDQNLVYIVLIVQIKKMGGTALISRTCSVFPCLDFYIIPCCVPYLLSFHRCFLFPLSSQCSLCVMSVFYFNFWCLLSHLLDCLVLFLKHDKL